MKWNEKKWKQLRFSRQMQYEIKMDDENDSVEVNRKEEKEK